MKKVKLFRVLFNTESHEGSLKKPIYNTWDEYKEKGTIMHGPDPAVNVVAEDITGAIQFVCEHFDEIADTFNQKDRFLVSIGSVSEIEHEALC